MSRLLNGLVKLVLLIVVVVVLIGVLTARKEPPAAGPSTGATDDVVQVSRFNTPAANGFTFYAKHPTQSSLRAFCDDMKRRNVDDAHDKRILKAHFYDSRESAPDVSAGYNLPESSETHLVADYLFNPSNGATHLNFHKTLAP